MENTNIKKPRFEYEHFDLPPGSGHFGKHSVFGHHIGLGSGSNSVHLYGTKLYFGGREGSSITLNPAQMRIAQNVLWKAEQLSSKHKPIEKLVM